MEKKEKVQKLYARLMQQLNKDNKGASLVTVLLITSIVAILVTAVLAIVILNVYMRQADLQGQDNFYDAESALEEVRAGLATDVSDATAKAYVTTLKNYNSLPDEESKNKFFNKEFLKELRSSSTTDGRTPLVEASGKYNIDKLQGYLKKTKDNAVIGITSDSVEDDDQDYIDSDDARYNETKQGAVLKNVRVEYTDPDTKFVSKIKTDIVLGFPDVSFNNASSSENILTYALIASDIFSAKGNVDVVGNAYIGGKAKVTDSDAPAADISGAKNLVFNKAEDMDETSVICGGDILIDDTSSVLADGVNVWADSLRINNSDFQLKDGALYLKNDLDLQNKGESTLSGKLVMFGNYAAVLQTEMFNNVKHVQQDWAKDNSAYSSSILLSGAGTKLDLKNLNTMVIGGSAYIDTESNYAALQGGWSDVNMNMTTGQSMMMKPDQRAYMVPATVVGAGLDAGGSDYTNGLANPMTANQFKKLQEEIKDNKGYTDINKIQLSDYANMNKVDETLGASIYGFYKSFFDGAADGIDLGQYDLWQSEDIKNGHFVDGDSQSQFYTNLNNYKQKHDALLADMSLLKKILENGYKPTSAENQRINEELTDYRRYECIKNRPTVAINAYQTDKSSPIVYLFIKFYTFGDPFNGVQGVTYVPAEGLYNEWYRLYNANYTNKNKLLSNLSYYAPNGIRLPNNVDSDATKMYFTGNILTTEKADLIVHDWLTKGLTMELANQYYAQSAEYQDEYFTMKRTLSKRFASLSDEERAQEKPSIYDNLIETGIVQVNGNSYNIGKHGETAYYKYNTNNVAVVTTDDYTYNSDVKKKNLGEGQELNVIICAGNVTIDENFEGMIIAGGSVTINTGKTVKANSVKVAEALSAAYDDTEEGQYDCAANFVKNANGYTKGGAGEPDEETGELTMKEFVTYRNWTRE